MPKRPRKKQPIVEFQESKFRPEEEIVEYDESSGPTEGLAQVEETAEDTSIVAIEAGLLQARDELEKRMGGFEAVAAALTEPSESPTSGLGNIVGWGIGEKIVGTRFTGDIAVKVYVIEKLSASELEPEAMVPEEINGYPTDVQEVGDVSAQVFTGKARPAPMGSSVGHPKITAGTMGCLVVRNNNHLCLLSNNHVLANVNESGIGDPILQPGPLDGGRNPRDRIGTLEAFVPINFSGPNLVDAAVAWTSFANCKTQHHCYGIRPDPLKPALFMSVRKCGRTTQHTVGLITAVAVSLNVRFGARLAFFRDQIEIRGLPGDFSRPGDSGSLVVSAGSLQPVALLFAGGGGFTFANPLREVINALGIRRFLT
jgi:hypothetical protein